MLKSILREYFFIFAFIVDDMSSYIILNKFFIYFQLVFNPE